MRIIGRIADWLSGDPPPEQSAAPCKPEEPGSLPTVPVFGSTSEKLPPGFERPTETDAERRARIQSQLRGEGRARLS